MAASTAGSSLSLRSRISSPESPRLNPRPRAARVAGGRGRPRPPRAASLSMAAAPKEEGEGGGIGARNGASRALELSRAFEGSGGANVQRDAQLLPRPLSSIQSSNPSSDGSRLRVAYQGVRGAYSESAAEKAYPNCEAVPCEQFDTAFQIRLETGNGEEMLLGMGVGALLAPLRDFTHTILQSAQIRTVRAYPAAIRKRKNLTDFADLGVSYLSWYNIARELAVEKWLVDRAVLPIENSLGGSIHRNYDLLIRHRLHIVGEVKLAVKHCLLANHGVEIGDLRRVLSHPQALAQCEHTLTKMGLVREEVDDTAGAAKHIAFHNLKDAGAVASAAAAKIYDLNILARDIQDDSDNVTRFLMLAREPIIPGTDRPFKTSIVFSLEEGPGVLFKALAVFALRQVNLTKIESRPLRKQTVRTPDDSSNGAPKYFDYHFYVDFEASMADVNAQNALRHLNEFATSLRVLGSYPVDTSMI